DRPQRHLALADVRPGKWRAVGKCRINSHPVRVAEANDSGKKSKLIRSSRDLSRESDSGEPGLFGSPLDNHWRISLDILGDSFKKRSSWFGGQLPIVGEGRL